MSIVNEYVIIVATSSETTSSLEQEKYLMALVAATPLSVLRQGSAWGMSDSSLSIDSLLLAAEDRNATPEQTRRNPFNKAIGTLGYVLFYSNIITYYLYRK